MPIQSIDDTLLATVTGGATANAMQFDPSLAATVTQAGRTKPPPKPAPEMLQAVRNLGDSISGFATVQRQSQQQSSQQMMQLLPQMLAR